MTDTTITFTTEESEARHFGNKLEARRFVHEWEPFFNLRIVNWGCKYLLVRSHTYPSAFKSMFVKENNHA